MIVMQVEIEDGSDVLHIQSTQIHEGDELQPDAQAFLAGEKLLIASAPDAFDFLTWEEIADMALKRRRLN